MTILKTISFLFFILLFVQCKGSKNGKIDMKKPEDVTLAFLRTFSSLDFEKSKLYSTPETQQLLSMVESMMAGLGDDEKQKMKAETAGQVKSLKTAKCRTEGDVAYCKVCCGPDGSEIPEETTLKKIDGKWLVHIDKSAIGGGEDEN
jgi:Domain of unknown function (DUF4878)